MANENFGALWTRLVYAATSAGDERFKATLMNHEGRKEGICRRLGVICLADVDRIEAVIKGRRP